MPIALMGFFFWDWTYILVIIGGILSLGASALVQSNYRRYSAIASRSGITGAQAARRILQAGGVGGVAIQAVPGQLTDHYNPGQQSLGLSEGVYDSPSIAAIGIAAHEAGHAIQHGTGYALLGVRNAIVPIVNIGSRLSVPILMVGFLMQSSFGDGLLKIGLVLFSFSMIFTLLTLPVEFDASARAVRAIRDQGILSEEELAGTRKVLNAAALTYVAAAAAAILSFLRIFLLIGGRRRNH